MTPFLKVLKGEPTEEELAAVTVALLAATAPPVQEQAPRPRQRLHWHRLGEPYAAPTAWTTRL
ncbi:acyl-CoA carboxylase epsilon subunit [Saccharothrix hoggarensis]|uniref:Acyl-CoA carboxylase epsilon subunit n=1 Tax=Saccharothrix hoggarensis TaxID=913853 RepID=A0ABW3R136_9PSEU